MKNTKAGLSAASEMFNQTELITIGEIISVRAGKRKFGSVEMNRDRNSRTQEPLRVVLLKMRINNVDI